MSGYIVNAAPMVIELGTQDLSTRQLPRETDAVPQHLPKFFLFCRKGPTEPQLVVGNERINMFGEETFDERSIYANHATVYSNLVNAQSNVAMIQRIVPPDAGPQANMILWLDVLPTTVDLYQRNPDGSIKLDNTGSPIIIGTAPGYKVKWVKTNRVSDSEMEDYGKATILPGSQVDPVTSTQSSLYPIFEFKASSRGDHGNHSGIRLWPVNKKTVVLPPNRLMSEQRAFPYYIQVIRRKNASATPRVVPSVFSEEHFMITLKEGVIEPLTDKQLYLGDIFVDSYNRGASNGYPATYGDMSSMVIYKDNIELLHGMFHTTEIPFIDEFSDITSDEGDKWLMNIMTGLTSAGTPYHSIKFIDDADSIRFSEYANIFMEGGSDGTMNDQIFAELVAEEMERYLDPNDPLMENAINVESVLYDSGFPIETKFQLCNFIGSRRDTFVVLGTFDANDRVLLPAEEHSLAIALRTRLQMFPESDYFGTPVMRGMIIGRSGKLRNSRYTRRLPLTAEVAIKSARFMGAANGQWRNGYNFDGAPGSIIDHMYEISHPWVPAQVRNRNWDVGLNWVQAYDRRSYFFPALKTVYNDDTSVLNSYFTAMAICTLNKVAHACWREFSGVSHLSNAQLEERVNNFINNNVKGRFDGRFIIQPDAHHDDMDVLRGFSWTLPIKIYAPNMKTVMRHYIQAFRISDLDVAA